MAQSICGGLANVLPFLDYGNVKCVESSFPCRRASLFQRGRLDNIFELLKHVCMPHRSLEVALVTAQRREDVRQMLFRDVREDMLWVEQEKTGAKVRIPLNLRLNAVGWSVSDIIQRCRDNVISRHLIHHNEHQGRAKPGDKVRATSLSCDFAKARELAKIKWPAGKSPASFHEIRSLAARLYAEQGVDVQALLGHKSPDMTAIYRDVRGAEWISVQAV